MAKGLRKSQHQSLTETATPRLLPFVCNSGIIGSREESLQKGISQAQKHHTTLIGISKGKKRGPPHGQSQGSSHSFSQYVSDNQGSVQFSRSVVFDSLRPNGLQHARPPCPSPTHVHWVGDAVQPSHPLSSPSPPTFNLSQHQGLFKWVSSSHRWPKYRSFNFNISPSKIRGSGTHLARCH